MDFSELKREHLISTPDSDQAAADELQPLASKIDVGATDSCLDREPVQPADAVLEGSYPVSVSERLAQAQIGSKWQAPGSVSASMQKPAKRQSSRMPTKLKRGIQIALFAFVLIASGLFAIFNSLMPEWPDLFKGHARSVVAMQHFVHSWKLIFAPDKVSNVTIALDAAWRKSKEGDHLGAIKDYELLSHTFPSPRLYNNLAIENLKLGRQEQALLCLNEALALNPNFPMALIGRGCIFAQQGDYESAMRDFNRAIRIGYPQGYFCRSGLYKVMGKAALADRDESIIAKHGYKNEPFTMVPPPPPDEL